MGNKNYKTVNIYPKDFDRLVRLANGRPLGRQIGLILDALEKNGLRIQEIGMLPCPEGCEAVPVVTVSVGGE